MGKETTTLIIQRLIVLSFMFYTSTLKQLCKDEMEDTMTVQFEDHQTQNMLVDPPAEWEEQIFADRRFNAGVPPGVERRQFSNHYGELSLETRELATAIDQYKLIHRRRFITYDEMLAVIKSLGYHK